MQAVVNAIFMLLMGVSNGVCRPMSILTTTVSSGTLANVATTEATGNASMTPNALKYANKKVVTSIPPLAVSTLKVSRRRGWEANVATIKE